jgi:hypothetical protein
MWSIFRTQRIFKFFFELTQTNASENQFNQALTLKIYFGNFSRFSL